MNSTTTPRFAALVLAVSVTLAMLSGIGLIAHAESAHAQIAAAAAAARA